MTSTTLIEVPQWWNVTLIEALWLASGLAAVAFCASHLPELRSDWVAAIASGRRTLHLVARSSLRREYVRLFIGMSITGIGIYSAVTPPALPGPAVISIVGIVITVVFLAISASTALMSWWDWHDRATMIDLIDSGANGPPEGEPNA